MRFSERVGSADSWATHSGRPASNPARSAQLPRSPPIFAALEGALDGFRSSMQKDVAAGLPPELDAIAGPILRGGGEHGIEVLATRAFEDRIMALG